MYIHIYIHICMYIYVRYNIIYIIIYTQFASRTAWQLFPIFCLRQFQFSTNFRPPVFYRFFPQRGLPCSTSLCLAPPSQTATQNGRAQIAHALETPIETCRKPVENIMFLSLWTRVYFGLRCKSSFSPDFTILPNPVSYQFPQSSFLAVFSSKRA